MKIVILGGTGMLGSKVGKYFTEKYGCDNILISHRPEKEITYTDNTFCYDVLTCDTMYVPDCDYLINCIGMIKPRCVKWQEPNTVFINSYFPWYIANDCEYRGIRMIHITTDCVYSGIDGSYTENSVKDAKDLYGKSKALGEPDNCMVLRTSIIGEELYNKVSLVEWAKSQKGKSVFGYTNHLWNGITTQQYAAVCDAIIKDNVWTSELIHIFSNKYISKLTLLSLLNEKFDLDLAITPTEADVRIDRTLYTNNKLNYFLNMPNIEDQIKDM